jgi:hypothetical protein
MTPTITPDDYTYVYVWNSRMWDWQSLPARHILCSECGEHYKESSWAWSGISNGYPYLICECGEQFHQFVDEEITE